MFPFAFHNECSVHLGQSVTSHLHIFPSSRWFKATNSHTRSKWKHATLHSESRRSKVMLWQEKMFLLRIVWSRFHNHTTCKSVQLFRNKPQVCVLSLSALSPVLMFERFQHVFMAHADRIKRIQRHWKSSERCGQDPGKVKDLSEEELTEEIWDVSYFQSRWACAIWLACKLPEKTTQV